MIDNGLVVQVVHDAARTLGEDVPLPVLSDERLDDPELATEIVAAASYHAVLPLLWHAINRATDAPPAIRAAVGAEYKTLVARALRLQHLVRVVDETLSDAGIAYAVYKGAAVARHYPAVELRAFGDVDLLVDRRDTDRAHVALHTAGLRGGWSGVPDDYAETNYTLGGHGILDAHWHVMREAKVRSAFQLDTGAMLRRAQRRELSNGSAVVLDTTDELIAVATHACFDGAYRLGWFVDIARLVMSAEFDAAEVRRRTVQTQTSLPVQVIIDRAQRALDVDAPPPFARGPWRRSLNRLATARPVERTFRQAARGGLAYRATRATSLRSFVALGDLVFTEGVRPLITDPQHRWRRVRTRRI